jgi:hypothetical protein
MPIRLAESEPKFCFLLPHSRSGMRSKPATTVLTDFPSEHMLKNFYILSLIFAELNALWEDDKNLPAKDIPKAFMSLAMTCKAFFAHAAAHAWHTMDSIIPLLRLFPGFSEQQNTWVRRPIHWPVNAELIKPTVQVGRAERARCEE